MLNRLRSILQGACRLEASGKVLVGVSGGPDSLCLLDSLWQLGYSLVVAHLDHGLRPESGDEAQVVRRAVKSLGAPFELRKVDVEAFAASNSLSLEEAARTLRYRFLFELAGLHQAQAVAVGHTADDQVETVLMHLLRGAGLSGLKGMAYRSLPNSWSREIPLVRPLLGIWRSEVEAYNVERGLQPAQDPSNLDTRFYRNRLRHELIPYLESYNPRLRQAIWRTADVLREDHTVLEGVVQAAWEASVLEQGAGYVSFKSQALLAQPLGVQRWLLRRAIGSLRPGLRDIDFEVLEEALAFLHQPTRSGQRDLAAGLRLLLEEERLWLAAWEADLPGGWPQLPPGTAFSLEVPGKLALPGGWELRAALISPAIAREKGFTNTNPFQAWLDWPSSPVPLQVRGRRPGDRFRPLGLDGHSVKLSDFMVNVKLPRRARPGWPLLLFEQEIAWLPGFRLAHPFRLTGETQQAVHVQLSRKA